MFANNKFLGIKNRVIAIRPYIVRYRYDLSLRTQQKYVVDKIAHVLEFLFCFNYLTMIAVNAQLCSNVLDGKLNTLIMIMWKTKDSKRGPISTTRKKNVPGIGVYGCTVHHSLRLMAIL